MELGNRIDKWLKNRSVWLGIEMILLLIILESRNSRTCLYDDRGEGIN